MVKPIETIDHVDDAAGNFLSQYQNLPVFNGYVNSFLKELDGLETEYNLFKTTLNIQSALGANLTQWGIILQASQRPPDDSALRVLLFALIGAYNSEGHAKDIRALILSVLQADGIFIDDNGGATFSFTVFNPTFTFGVDLVSEIVNLAKPAGVEFLGFTIADIYSEPTFSFVGDTRIGSSSFAVAVPVFEVATNWVNWIYAGPAAITLTQRIDYVLSGSESAINFITATSDTQWRDDINNDFDGFVGSIIAWDGKDGSLFHITSLSSSGIVSHAPSGDSTITKILLTDSDGTALCLISRNRSVLVPTQMTNWISVLEYVDTDSAITLGKTLNEAPFDPDNYGVRDGGRYSLFV